MATNASAKAKRPAQTSASAKDKAAPAPVKPAAAPAPAPAPAAPSAPSANGGVTPIYITEQALVRWQMKTGPDITDVVPFKYLKKADIVKELVDTGFMCDFYDIRDAVKAYPGEDLLLIYDPTSQYGQNYYWCSSLDRVATEEQRLRDKAEGKAEEKQEEKAAEEQEVLVERPPEDFEDKPMVARAWESLGSEEEVYQLTVKNSRRPLGFTITRKRREFGKRVDLTDADPPDKIEEFRRQKVPGYELEKAVLELGFQIAPFVSDGATQTACYRLLNKGIQSEPIQMVEAEKQRLLDSSEMKLFVSSVSRLCEEALLQNETVDLFKNEFAVFQDEEVGTANRNENTLKGIHTFTHLTFSKGRKICAINWHPAKVGVVAFGCSSNLSFDEWVESSGQVASSTILVWNFSNVLQPEYILQVPGNLTCFSISPHNPLLIAGGLSSGQVVYWNLAEVKTKANRQRTEEAQASGDSAGAGGAQERAQETQYATIQPTMISYVDKSHSRHVTDIKWLPKGMKVKKNGEIRLQEAEWGSMFVSSSTDGMLLFWDLLSPQEERQRELDRSNASGSAGAPSPIPGGEASEGELKWTYVYSVPIKRLDSQSLLSVFRLSVNGTRIACVTEDGEVAFGDWSLASSFSAFGANAFNLSNNSLGAAANAGAPPASDKEKKETAAAAAVAAAVSDGPKQIISKMHKGHVHAGMAIHRSPHFPDLYLSIGDYSFSIWREDLDYPIFSSPYASDLLTCGCWSPTRPAVIFVAKRDGSVDVWELLDQCHRETMTYSASQSAISSLECWQSKLSSQQLLAVGDSEGNLHVLEVPKPLRRKLAKEEKLMRDFYDREVHRVEFAAKRASGLREAAKTADGAESDAKPAETAEAMRAATPIDKAEEEFQKLLSKYRSELAD